MNAPDLIIVDDATDRSVHSARLRQAGRLTFSSAEDAETGLEQLRSRSVDCVLLDDMRVAAVEEALRLATAARAALSRWRRRRLRPAAPWCP